MENQQIGDTQSAICALLTGDKRDIIASLEPKLLALPQVECPVVHHFGPGICIREVSMKAGTFAIGHHQRFEHINILLKGSVTMLDDDGSVVIRSAPLMYIGMPGRKIGYVTEDMVWQNIYATDETDVETIEGIFIDKTMALSNQDETADKLKFISNQGNRNDFRKMIAEIGMTEEQVRLQSENEGDQIQFPYGSYKVALSKSFIEGTGMFATAEINDGEVIAPARINGKRTPAGRYVNHSATPNARMVALPGGDIDLVAIASISGSHGGKFGDEITVDYRQAMSTAAQAKELICQA
jgi:hypothetical protein